MPPICKDPNFLYAFDFMTAAISLFVKYFRGSDLVSLNFEVDRRRLKIFKKEILAAF